MKELINDAVQSVTFNASVNFAGDRIARRLRKALALVSRSIHAQQPPQLPEAAHRNRRVTPMAPNDEHDVAPAGGVAVRL